MAIKVVLLFQLTTDQGPFPGLTGTTQPSDAPDIGYGVRPHQAGWTESLIWDGNSLGPLINAIKTGYGGKPGTDQGSSVARVCVDHRRPVLQWRRRKRAVPCFLFSWQRYSQCRCSTNGHPGQGSSHLDSGGAQVYPSGYSRFSGIDRRICALASVFRCHCSILPCSWQFQFLRCGSGQSDSSGP
jgi:hypothetical protein